MQCLYDGLVVHQAHHIMVESEILKRTVPLLEKAESMEPIPPPPTPPPPSQPPSPEQGEEDAGENTEVEEDEKFCHSNVSTRESTPMMDYAADSPAVASPVMASPAVVDLKEEAKEEREEIKEEMKE